jgi:nitroimidazol reductase NimA-like FMN-containing flavoprotein (pyridoxamine 5'-phosphate oxidase superfamily)
MNQIDDSVAHGRAIIDANLYMVLGTADADGRPWATPVYFAPVDYREFLWVSRPGATHSRNIEARSEISIVIFDSTVPINTGRAVYVSATAAEVGEADRAAALEAYSQRAVAHGGEAFAPEDVQAPAHLRLYRAVAGDQYILSETDERIPVSL